MPKLDYKNRLFMPTIITKLNDKYFIVDCHNHRIIYSNNINNDISNWEQIDFEFAGCHTIASDGNVYIIDNTGLNEVIVLDSNLKFKQKFTNIGSRPHYTIYDSNTNLFYVISSLSQEMYCYKTKNNVIIEHSKYNLSFLNSDDYTRSFNIIDGYMYIVTNAGKIHKVNYIDNSFSLIESYDAPGEIAGLNHIIKIGDYFYITNTQNKNGDINPNITRIKDLSKLFAKEYEVIYSKLGFVNTPYIISQIYDKIFIPEIGENVNGIKYFDVNDLNLNNVNTILESAPNEENFKRFNIYPA